MPAGRLVDRFGAARLSLVGLVGMATGCFALCMLPATLGIPGYVGPMLVVTVGYAFFQTADNSAVMAEVGSAQRGVVWSPACWACHATSA